MRSGIEMRWLGGKEDGRRVKIEGRRFKVWFQSDVVCSARFRSFLRVGKISLYIIRTMDTFLLWNLKAVQIICCVALCLKCLDIRATTYSLVSSMIPDRMTCSAAA